MYVDLSKINIYRYLQQSFYCMLVCLSVQISTPAVFCMFSLQMPTTPQLGLKRPRTIIDRDDLVEEGDYEEDLLLLQSEIAKAHPKRKVIRKLMKTTFMGRRKWILSDRPVVSEILDCFPQLKKVKYVSYIVNNDIQLYLVEWSPY